MKIILTAFNEKLKSDVMEYPDNTGVDFWLPLPFDQSFQAEVLSNEMLEASQEPRGRFRHTGRYYIKNDVPIAIYALTEFVDYRDEQIGKLKQNIEEYEEEAQRRNINSLKDSDFGRITGRH